MRFGVKLAIIACLALISCDAPSYPIVEDKTLTRPLRDDPQIGTYAFVSRCRLAVGRALTLAVAKNQQDMFTKILDRATVFAEVAHRPEFHPPGADDARRERRGRASMGAFGFPYSQAPQILKADIDYCLSDAAIAAFV
jgi:hypothetical protein